MCNERYTQMVMYENYLLDLELNQKAMNDYVNECIILSNPDKKQVISELAVFNEGKVGDKFKKVWARIKSFFSKIYQRFLESLSAWASDNKDYLTTYSNVIFQKKVTLKNVRMSNHFEGLKRFNQLATNSKGVFTDIPKISNIEDITARASTSATNANAADVSTKAVDAFTIEQQTEAVKAAWGDGVVKTIVEKDDPSGYAGRCRAYMNGDQEDFTGSQLEGKLMENMYNFCYKYDDLVANLKKIKDAYDKGMANIETEYKKGIDEAKKALSSATPEQKDAVKNVQDASVDVNNNDHALAAARKDADAAVDKAESEEKKANNTSSTSIQAGYVYSSVYNNYINEDGAQITTGPNNNSSDTATVTGTGESDKKNANLNASIKSNNTAASGAASNIKDKASQTSGAAKNSALSQTYKTGAENEAALAKYEDNAISMLRAYGNARSLIMGAALNALSDARKDYFDIIRAHVRSWVGAVDKKSDNTDTKPQNTDSSV